jgi:hypothetical protein
MDREFWITAGGHLLNRNDSGRLVITLEFLRAILARPELQPVEESCDAEIALHEDLQRNPELDVAAERVALLADPDGRENYELVLAFRDVLRAHDTVEAAYLEMVRPGGPRIPPLFASQLVHVLLRNILRKCDDPIRLRAAELFFRAQNVNTEGGVLMLADEEIVEMYAAGGGMGGLGQLLASSDTPMRNVELDVLDEDNKQIYWERSDRFDTVIDFRFTQPALDAFARVLEAWVVHFLGIRVRVQPMQRIDDEKWSWHVGLDAEATQILNALYEGADPAFDDMQRIIALFRMEVVDRNVLRADLQGKPIYLGLAKTAGGVLRMKPQNLLMNLPLASDIREANGRSA